MASRAIIGKVNRRGDGQAIYLGHDGDPDVAGATLLEHYSAEEPIDRLISRGSVTWLEARPEDSIAYFRDHAQTWENCRPYAFPGGTERFFAHYWGPGPEWLYVWTPDGWLSSEAMPGAPPDCYYTDTRTAPDVNDPEWREWLRKTGEFQRPEPLHSLIRDYPDRQRGSDDRDAAIAS